LSPLLPFWKAGTFGAVQAVGQPVPNRSHFAAMEELERAAPGSSTRTGWLDRMTGTQGVGDPLGAVSLGTFNPPTMLAGPMPDLQMTSMADFRMLGDEPGRPAAATMSALYDGAPAVQASLVSQTLATLSAVSDMRTSQPNPGNGAVYPSGPLGTALKDLAVLVKSNAGLRTACIDSGDWDMHTSLGKPAAGGKMFDNLAVLGKALAAFATDLGPQVMRRVTLVTISEFGRRVGQNGSGGLDHGYGNAMLLLGGGVVGGRVHGRWPGLSAADLVDGDLAVTTDYRAVIGEILQKRCGVGNFDAVFPGVKASSLGVVSAR
jgi:uncharacterized protein (DUF1501 family)